eukprot:3116739-Amphidinium_carterae.1
MLKRGHVYETEASPKLLQIRVRSQQEEPSKCNMGLWLLWKGNRWADALAHSAPAKVVPLLEQARRLDNDAEPLRLCEQRVDPPSTHSEPILPSHPAFVLPVQNDTLDCTGAAIHTSNNPLTLALYHNLVVRGMDLEHLLHAPTLFDSNRLLTLLLVSGACSITLETARNPSKVPRRVIKPRRFLQQIVQQSLQPGRLAPNLLPCATAW